MQLGRTTHQAEEAPVSHFQLTATPGSLTE